MPTWSALIGWIGNSPEFEAGIRLIERGEYRTSVTLLTRAVAEVPGGTVCKLGGFYSCWLAQALHNAGSEAEAKALLERLSSHADAEVRRSASDMLAIFTAPKLDFVEGTFLTIPPLTPDDGWSRTAGSSGGRSGLDSTTVRGMMGSARCFAEVPGTAPEAENGSGEAGLVLPGGVRVVIDSQTGELCVKVGVRSVSRSFSGGSVSVTCA